MEKYIEIGNRLKYLRGELSQKEFAKKIKVSYVAYQNYEYGKRVPPGPVLSRIANISYVTVDYILTGDEASLRKDVQKLGLKLEYISGQKDQLDKELRRKLKKKGVPIPVSLSISSYIDVHNFLKKHGIYIEDLFKAKKEGISYIDDPELSEIIQILKEFPDYKTLVLRLLKGKRESDSAMEELKKGAA